MKAILEFNLDDHDDDLAHKRCVKALDMALVLWEMSANVRKECEYAMDDSKMTAPQMLDLVFEKYQKLLDEYNIQPENLTE